MLVDRLTLWRRIVIAARLAAGDHGESLWREDEPAALGGGMFTALL